MNISDNEMIIFRPVVAVHLRLVVVDVVRKDDVPALFLQCEPYETDAGKELRRAHAGFPRFPFSRRKADILVARAFRDKVRLRVEFRGARRIFEPTFSHENSLAVFRSSGRFRCRSIQSRSVRPRAEEVARRGAACMPGEVLIDDAVRLHQQGRLPRGRAVLSPVVATTCFPSTCPWSRCRAN